MTPPAETPARTAALFAGLLAFLALFFVAWSNHFHNSFHFDDSHTILNNPYIRDPRNIPRFFTDARTFSTNPAAQIYRPVVSTSLAVDYWLARGLNPLPFHLSTFFWFIVELGLMFVLFRKTFDRARPNPYNAWVALFATAVYAVHPAMAETVNYIVQRADLYSTLGVIGGLVVWIAAARWRRYGLYLAPVVLGLLSKEPAAVFPVLLFVWIRLFEEEDWRKALRRSLPAFVVTGACALFLVSMEPPSYAPGALSVWNYRISQPAVLLTYFRKFFIPVGFSADTGRAAYTSLSDPAVLTGFVFITAMATAAFWFGRRRETRPIAFGLAWFLISSFPTSWIALADMENDHRLFFPFVGLALASTWVAWLWLTRRSLPRVVWASAGALVLAALAGGTQERNEVWHSDESLWFDVTVQNPRNGRGLMNYGGSQMALGRYETALDYFQRALVLNPSYSTLEVNLGSVNAALNRNAEAERHYLRALELAPRDAVPKYFYAVFLNQTGRVPEAVSNLKSALEDSPSYIDASHLLMRIYAARSELAGLRALADKTLRQFPSDPVAESVLAPTAEDLLDQSLTLYRAGKFEESIAAARGALKLKPNYPEAWNNIAAAYLSLSDWDNGIAADEQALRLRPDYPIARHNLDWAKAQKRKTDGPSRK